MIIPDRNLATLSTGLCTLGGVSTSMSTVVCLAVDATISIQQGVLYFSLLDFKSKVRLNKMILQVSDFEIIVPKLVRNCDWLKQSHAAIRREQNFFLHLRMDLIPLTTDFPAAQAPPKEVKYIVLSLLLIYMVYIIVSVTLFYRRRNDYFIQQRAAGLCVISSICNFLVVTMYLTRYAYYDSYPCALILWITSVCTPMFFVVSFLARGVDLYCSYKLNKAKLEEGYNLRRNSQVLSTSSKSESITLYPNLQRSSTDYTLTIDPRLPPPQNSPNLPGVSFFNHGDGKVKLPKSSVQIYRSLKNRIPLVVVIALVFHLLSAIVTQIISQISPDQHIYALSRIGTCSTSSLGYSALYERLPAVISVSLYGLVGLPLLLHKLGGVKDAFGIKRDLCYSIFVGFPLIFVYMFWRYSEFTNEYRIYFPPFMFIVFALAMYHTISITIPAYYSYTMATAKVHPVPVQPSPIVHGLPTINEESEDALFETTEAGYYSSININLPELERRRSIGTNNPLSNIQSIEDLFEDPVLLEQFREFTVMEFSVENLFFYEEYRLFKDMLRAEEMKDRKIVDERSVNINLEVRNSVCVNADEELSKSHTSNIHLNKLEDFVNISVKHNKISSPSVVRQMMIMYDRFILSGSPCELNLNDQTRKTIVEHIESNNMIATLFDQAAEEIIMLMTSWSLPRFLDKQRQLRN
jgi:hypothetical protein